MPDIKRVKGLPSVLGFYKENQGSEGLCFRICGDSPELYVEVLTHLRNRLEVVLGSRFVGKLSRIIKKNGEKLDTEEEEVFEVKGY